MTRKKNTNYEGKKGEAESALVTMLSEYALMGGGATGRTLKNLLTHKAKDGGAFRKKKKTTSVARGVPGSAIDWTTHKKPSSIPQMGAVLKKTQGKAGGNAVNKKEGDKE